MSSIPWWLPVVVVFGAPFVFAGLLGVQAWREARRQREREASVASHPRPHVGVSLRADMDAQAQGEARALDAQRSNPRRPGRAERRGL